MLQKGLGRSAEQNRGLGGDIRLKSGPYLVLFVLLHGRETWLGPTKDFSRKYIATREISPSRRPLSAVFTMCYANAHPAIWQPTCTELYRGGIGHRRYLKGYDCGPNSIVRNNLGSETIFLVSCHMTYKPPQADSPES